MKTTKKIMLLATLLLAQISFVQCSSEPANASQAPLLKTEKTDADQVSTNAVTATADTVIVANSNQAPTYNIRIAYVDYDILLANYNFAQEIQKEIMRRELSINNEIEDERKKLMDEATVFEQKIQNNVFATQERAQAEYDKILLKEQDIIQRGQAMIEEFEIYRNTKYDELSQNIDNYIQEYNKVAKYDFILTRVGGNMLYANESLDITQEIVNGLNAK